MWIFAALITSLCFGINNSIFKWSSGKVFQDTYPIFSFIFSFYFVHCLWSINGWFAAELAVHHACGAAIGVLNANGNIRMASAF